MADTCTPCGCTMVMCKVRMRWYCDTMHIVPLSYPTHTTPSHLPTSTHTHHTPRPTPHIHPYAHTLWDLCFRVVCHISLQHHQLLGVGRLGLVVAQDKLVLRELHYGKEALLPSVEQVASLSLAVEEPVWVEGPDGVSVHLLTCMCVYGVGVWVSVWVCGWCVGGVGGVWVVWVVYVCVCGCGWVGGWVCHCLCWV